MTAAPPETLATNQAFEHQPEMVETAVDLPETYGLPQPNDPPRTVDATRENFETDNIAGEIAKLRKYELDIADRWAKFNLPTPEGSYVKGYTKEIREDGKLRTKLLQGPDAHENELRRYERMRQVIVNRLATHMNSSDGERVTQRLLEKATRQAIGGDVHVKAHETLHGEQGAAAAFASADEAYVRTRQATRDITHNGGTLPTKPDASKATGPGSRTERVFRRASSRLTRLSRGPFSHGLPELVEPTERPLHQHDRPPLPRESVMHNRPAKPGSAQAAAEARAGATLAAGDANAATAEAVHDHYRMSGLLEDARRDLIFVEGYRDGETEYLGNYETMITDIIIDAGQKRREAVYEAGEAIDQIGDELFGWPLGEALRDDAAEDEIERLMLEASDRIDSLPGHDNDRGQLVDQLARLRYRVLQRRLSADAANMADPGTYRGLYTDDGGIYINTPGNQPVVVYEDGSVSRNEDGRLVRRWGNGNVWTAQREVPLGHEADPSSEFARDDGIKFIEQCEAAFATWENTRTPLTRARAAAFLEERIRQEESWVANRAASAPPYERAVVNESLNRNRYWHGLLTAEAVPPPDSPGRLGQLALDAAMDPAPPHVRPDGWVVMNGATINGYRGDWDLLPDGTTSLRQRVVNPADGALWLTTVAYNPDGSELSSTSRPL